MAKPGYWNLYWDYEEDGSVWDMTAAGPYLGLDIQFQTRRGPQPVAVKQSEILLCFSENIDLPSC